MRTEAYINEFNYVSQHIIEKVFDYNNATENKIKISEGDVQGFIGLYNNHLLKVYWKEHDNTIILEFVDTINNYHTEQDTALLIDLLQYGIEYKSQYRNNLIIKPQKDIIGSTTIIVCTLFWELNNH